MNRRNKVADSSPAMKHTISVAIRFLIIFAVIFTGITLLVIITVLTPPVQRGIKRGLEEALSKQLISRVSIGSVQLNWINRVEAKDILAVDRDGFQDSLKIGRLSIHLALFPLLKKKVEVRGVTIKDAMVSGIRTKGGMVRLPFLTSPIAQKGPKPNKRKGAWTIALRRVSISGLSASYCDSLSGTSYTLSRIEGRLRFFRLDSLGGTLSAGKGSASTPWYRGNVKRIDLRGALSPKKLVLSKGIIETPQGRLSCQGTIPFSKSLSWDAQADLTSKLSPLAVLLKKVSGLSVDDATLHARAMLQGSLIAPRGSLQMEVNDAVVKGIPCKTATLSADYTATGGRLRGTASLASSIGKSKATVDCSIPSLFFHPSIEAYSVTIHAEAASLKRLLSLAGVRTKAPEASIRLDGAASGLRPGRLPDSASVTLIASSPANPEHGDLVRCSAHLASRAWEAVVTADSGNRIAAYGAFGLRDSLSGAFNFEINNPAFLSRFIIGEPVTGALSGNGRIEGTVKRPSIAALVQGSAIGWRGLTVDQASADLHFSNQRFYFNDARLSASGELKDLLQRYRIKNVSGRFQVAATAFGDLAKPEVTAEAAIKGFRAGDLSAPSLTASLAWRGDTLLVKSLRLTKDTATLSATGMVHLAKTRRSLQATVYADRKGHRGAQVILAGALGRDTIDASASTTGFDLALLAPWLRGRVPVAGTATVQLSAHGPLANPDAKAVVTFDHVLPRGRTLVYRAEAGLSDSLLLGSIRVSRGVAADSLLLSFALPLSLRKPWSAARTVRNGARIDLAGSNVAIADLTAVFLPRTAAQGTVSVYAYAVKRHDGWEVDGTVRGALRRLVDSLHGVRADNLIASARATGTLTRPRFSLEAKGDTIVWNDHRFTGLVLSCRDERDTLFIDTAHIGVEHGRLDLTGSIPRGPGYFSFDKSGAALRLAATDIPISALGLASRQFSIEGGVVTGQAGVRMRENRPLVNGHLALRQGSFRISECAPPIGPVDADLTLRNDSIILESLRGQTGGAGEFHGSGTMEAGGQHHPLFSLTATDLRLQCPDMDIGIAHAVTRFADSGNAFVCGGAITLADTRYTIFLSPTNLFEQLQSRKPAPGRRKKPSSLLQRTTLRMVIDLNRNVTLTSNIGSFTLDGTVTIVGTPLKPGIVGSVTATEGYVYYLDRKFTISQAGLRFTNPNEIDPTINMVASTDPITALVSSGQANSVMEEKTYTVTLTLTGTLRKPVMVLTADPPLQPALIVSLITFGTTQGVGSDLSRRIEGFLAQQVAGFGTRKLGQLLNIESLNVEMQGTEGPSLTAVKRISSRLTVTYQAILQNLGEPKVTASYRLLPFLYIAGTGYYLHSGGIDLHFRLSK